MIIITVMIVDHHELVLVGVHIFTSNLLVGAWSAGIARSLIEGLRTVLLVEMIISALASAIGHDAGIRWEVLCIGPTSWQTNERISSSFRKEREVTRIIVILFQYRVFLLCLNDHSVLRVPQTLLLQALVLLLTASLLTLRSLEGRLFGHPAILRCPFL